jgi:hypothetical protein
MEVAMFSECSMLPRNRILEHRWADEAGEKIGTGEKFLAVLLSIAITGVLTVVMPFALLYLR